MATTLAVHGATVKQRHPLGPLGLSIITFGVYGIVWYFKINRELKDTTGEGNPAVSVLAITLGGLLLVPLLVSAYGTATRIEKLQDRIGVSNPISPVLAVVMLFVPLVNIFWTAYLQGALNRAWDRAGHLAAPAFAAGHQLPGNGPAALPASRPPAGAGGELSAEPRS
jgi:hypothetical protein